MSATHFFPPPQQAMRDSLNNGQRQLELLLQKRTRATARGSIARSGDRDPKLSMLHSGWAARLRYLPDGQAQICAILLPGDLVGLDALLFDRQTDDVIALTPCELDQADQGVVWAAIKREPDLAALMMWRYCEDGRRLRNWLVAMGRGDAAQRIALLLIDLRARLILACEIPAAANDIPFPLTQQVIADTLGLTAVHVNRVLKTLRDDELLWVRSTRATLMVHELAELALPLLDMHERPAPEFGLAAA